MKEKQNGYAINTRRFSSGHQFTFCVLIQIKPGYLKELVPGEAPETGDHWKTVMADIEKVIMPGVTHWHHPQVLDKQLSSLDPMQ